MLKSLRTVTYRAVASNKAAPLLRAPVPALRAFASSASAGNLLTEMAKENAHVDVVRYEHKNRKWSLNHVDYYSDALAIGFLETGLEPGDSMLCWLPMHFSETMVLQFACSKAGFVFYHLDPSVAHENQDLARKGLAQALALSKANVLVTQEAAEDVNFIHLVEDVIPDIDLFDFGVGMPFVCPQFPHLRLPIHTGYDQLDKWGFLRLHHMIVPSDNLDQHLEGHVLNGSTPLLGQFSLDQDGIPTGIGKTLTNDQVVQENTWPTFTNVLKKEFHEVEGVGVVF